jgi:hypothetical protein
VFGRGERRAERTGRAQNIGRFSWRCRARSRAIAPEQFCSPDSLRATLKFAQHHAVARMKQCEVCIEASVIEISKTSPKHLQLRAPRQRKSYLSIKYITTMLNFILFVCQIIKKFRVEGRIGIIDNSSSGSSSSSSSSTS